MATEEVVKSVAKKLKYYFEIKSLEDRFDIHQSVSNSQLKAGPVHQQYGKQDRAKKYYISQPEVRAMLKQLNRENASGALQGWREIEVRKMLEDYMKHYSFQSTLPDHYYWPTEEAQNSDLLRRRKRKQRNLPERWPAPQTAPDQHISKEEANRLINSATKIICGSEQFMSAGNLPYICNNNIGRLSALRLSQNEFSRPMATRCRGTSKKNNSTSPKKITRNGRSDNRQLSKKPRQQSLSPNSKSSRSSYRSTSSYLSQSSLSSSSRSSSVSSRSSSYSDHSSSGRSPAKTMPPKNKKVFDKKQQKEAGVGKATQTETLGKDIDGKLGKNKPGNTDKDEVVCDGPLSEYQVHVYTGNRVGAGTNAQVKLILYGEKGRTKEFDLNKLSKKNKIPFQKGNEDMFLISSYHVGRLKKIQIGHDKPDLSYAWYLENVSVQDMHEKRVYQFPCGRWLSGQSDEKKTYRILLADGEREFIEASDMKMTNSKEIQGAVTRSSAKDDHIKRSDVGENNHNIAGSQINSKNSSPIFSSIARIESGSPRHRQGAGSQRHQKDSFKQEATKIILRSVPGSQVVDEIILYNGGSTTENKDSDKSPVTEQEQKKSPQTVKETEKGTLINQNIHEAVRRGDSEGVKQLLDKYPAIKDHRDESGWTPLHLAATSSNTDMLRWLVTNKEDLKAETPAGQTAVHIAAVNGHVNTLMILQAMGASILTVTKEKQSALHLAARSGHLECVKWLVANNAFLDLKDSTGRTAFNLAEEHNKESCASFLRICMQEQNNPRNSIPQKLGRRTSGGDLSPIKEDTTLGSSGNGSKNEAEIQTKKKIYSD